MSTIPTSLLTSGVTLGHDVQVRSPSDPSTQRLPEGSRVRLSTTFTRGVASGQAVLRVRHFLWSEPNADEYEPSFSAHELGLVEVLDNPAQVAAQVHTKALLAAVGGDDQAFRRMGTR